MADSNKQKLYVSDTGETTFQYDKDLPSLPVPNLNDTLERYLDSVRPHLTTEEFEKTSLLVSTFGTGVGRQLNSLLLERASTSRNWLEEWWLKYAYMLQRTPILPLTNMAAVFEHNSATWPSVMDSNIDRAAIYLHYVLEFWSLIRNERFRPQKFRGDHMDMDQWKRLYNCSRIPGLVEDSLVSQFKTASEGVCAPMHVIVLCNGYMHKLDLAHGDSTSEGGSPSLLVQPEIRQQLELIWDRSTSVAPGPGIGALTCDNRDRWAKNRHWLQSLCTKNSEYIAFIDSALLVFVLDMATPRSKTELYSTVLGGDVSNRWADKAVSLIMTRNGWMGFNGEHSAFDAMPSLFQSHYCYLSVMESAGIWKGPKQVTRSLPNPVRFDFVVDSLIKKAIAQAKETAYSNIDDIEVKLEPRFRLFGKDFAKIAKVHPDTMVQMAIHLAYYRQHGRPGCGYETATTRRYYHGRTETLRSCTPEVISWAKGMDCPHLKNAVKRSRLFQAIAKHDKLMADGQDNKGCDRHLLGLYITAVENEFEIPELYKDPAYVKSGGNGNFVLSTSLSGFTPLQGGVPPMCHNGYGVFYAIIESSIAFTITAWKSNPETSAALLYANICRALEDIREVLTKSNL